MILMTVYNANNQLTQWGTTAMTYDANGNTLNDGSNSYVWDARNRLVSADNNAASFSYDPLGRRMGKSFMSANTNYLYDGANPVQELNGATPTANLLTGGVDERFTRTDASGTYNFLTDALGSTVALTDSTGNSQTQYSYDPYGSQSASGAYSTNSYTYTGRETDGLGIDYYRARYYNSTTGRFLSEDPAGFMAGTNFYKYVLDDPTDYRDPYGRDPVIGGIAGGIMGGIYGGMGAASTGGNGWDIATGALLGAGIGYGLGALDPSFGGAVVLGGLAGVAGDAAGQFVTNYRHGTNCYNVPEMVGAGIGGALGGGLGFGLGDLGIPASEDWINAFMSQFLSGAPGFAGTAAGWKAGEQNAGGKCGCH
jgi:RHS repeat-associated protein